MRDLEAAADRALPQFRIKQNNSSRPVAIDLFNHLHQGHGAKNHDPLLPSRRNIRINRHNISEAIPTITDLLPGTDLRSSRALVDSDLSIETRHADCFRILWHITHA